VCNQQWARSLICAPVQISTDDYEEDEEIVWPYVHSRTTDWAATTGSRSSLARHREAPHDEPESDDTDSGILLFDGEYLHVAGKLTPR
jgi:hypothetical protein